MSISAMVTGSTIWAPKPSEVDERLLHALHHFRIGVLRGEQLSHDAEPHAAHAVLIQEREVAVGPLALAGRGHLIRRIVTGDHVEDRHGVRHVPRHRAADVLVEKQRHDTVAAGEAHGRADADQARVRRGPADGVARVGPEADRAEVCGDRCGRAAARAGRDTIERVGVARVAGQQRVHGFHRIEGELRHVALGQHDGAGLAELLDLEGVRLRHHALQRERSRRGRHVGRLVVVLHDQWHAVQRADGTGLREFRVERVSDLERVGVGDDDGVERRPLLVVRVNAVEVHFRATRGLDRTLFQALIAGRWIEEAQNLVIEGPAGLGKSWLACALGPKACRDNRSVLYQRVPI